MRSYHVLLLAVTGCLTATGCSRGGRDASKLQANAGPRISIVYTAPHPVINEILDGFKHEVLSAFPNATFRERHAEGKPDQYSTVVLAAIADAPTLLAPITTPITKLAVQESRGRIPIVFMGVTDPVGAGVAQTINKPVLATGSSDLCPFDALLATARKLFPGAHIAGLPYNPTDEPAVFGRAQLKALAAKYNFELVDRQVSSRDELPADVRGLARRSDFLVLAADNLMMENPDLIATSAQAEGKPVIACDAVSVEKGAVAGVSVQYRDVGAAAGRLAVQVLRGDTAGNLPVAVLSSGGVVLNKKAACELHITFDSLVLTASTRFVDSAFICSRKR